MPVSTVSPATNCAILKPKEVHSEDLRWRDIPRVEGEGSPLVWGASDVTFRVGGVGWSRMKDDL